MARRTGDSYRIIRPVSLTMQELAEIEDLVESHQLPADYIDQHFDAVDAAVFGEDAPKDRHGNRKEQGLGSALNQTKQSLDAYDRWCGPGKPNADPDYENNRKKLAAQLVASDERRKAEAAKTRKPGQRRFAHVQS